MTLLDLVHASHPQQSHHTPSGSHTTPSLPDTPYKKHPYTRKEYTKKWGKQENRKFFKALKIFGTDFSLIANFFETRSRVQIKNKFRKEEKSNKEEVEEALQKHKRFHLNKMAIKTEQNTALQQSIHQRKLSLEQKDIFDVPFSPAVSCKRRRLSSLNSIDSLDIVNITFILAGHDRRDPEDGQERDPRCRYYLTITS